MVIGQGYDNDRLGGLIQSVNFPRWILNKFTISTVKQANPKILLIHKGFNVSLKWTIMN